ncbi:MAG: hypothetical protein ABSH16_07785 [Sedimentisphaerales bacterium]
MPFSENSFVIVLIMVNLVAGFSLAVPLANRFREITARQSRFLKFYVLMLGLYFVEGVAFGAGMCTQVFTIGLSFVWGPIFGLRLKGLAPKKSIIRQVLIISLYGCIPTVSFAVLITAFWVISGNGLLNVEQASSFGIPDFLPFPLNTVIGFCVALAAGTIILKTAFAAGITSLIVRKD